MVAYRAANAEIDAKQQPLRDQISAIEEPHRDRLKLEMIQQRFPENVQRAALKPEAERTPGEQLLAAQVLSINPPRRQVIAALSAAEAARRTVLVDRVDVLEQQRSPEPPMAGSPLTARATRSSGVPSAGSRRTSPARSCMKAARISTNRRPATS